MGLAILIFSIIPAAVVGIIAGLIGMARESDKSKKLDAFGVYSATASGIVFVLVVVYIFFEAQKSFP